MAVRYGTAVLLERIPCGLFSNAVNCLIRLVGLDMPCWFLCMCSIVPDVDIPTRCAMPVASWYERLQDSVRKRAAPQRMAADFRLWAMQNCLDGGAASVA